MIRTFGFWVIPDNPLYKRVQEIIDRYSKRLDTPVFLPHMTLLGTVRGKKTEILQKAENAVKTIEPFVLTVGEVEFSTTYFQCVFARVKTTAKLMEVHQTLGKHLDWSNDHVYMPHISLVYADVDMKTREGISNEIKLPNLEFLASKLAIVKADSLDPKTWDIVEKIRFGSR